MDEAPIIAGVRINLRAGSCSGSIISTYFTDATGPSDGMYHFNDLAEGTYCVSIDALDATNADILLPGSWTYPAGLIDNPAATATVTINASKYLLELNFGWDYQLD